MAKVLNLEGKNLSQGEEEILLKVVARAIPTYAMGYFKLLERYCSEIESLMACFWEGKRDYESKVH